jgi:outer membrane autotransporter protein
MNMGVRITEAGISAAPMSALNSEPTARNWTVWTLGYGAWGRTSADTNGYGQTTSSGGGGTIGIEQQVGDLMAGFLVSIGESLTRGDYPSYLRVRSDSWNVGSYGSISIGAITLDASALWGTSEQTSQRAGIGGTATARYETENWQTGVGVAANLVTGKSSWQVSPVARLKYINSSEDGFSETGSALNLGSSAHNNSHVLSKLGLRISKNGQLSSSVQFGIDTAAYWVHDFDSKGRNLEFTLGGTTYTSRTRDRRPDSVQFNLGMQATFSDMLMLRLSGQQDLSEDREQTTGVFTVGYKF